METRWLKPLFIIAGFYDAILAVAFLLFAPRIFQAFGVEPPNHIAYIQFPALLLIVFSIMFFRIASDPVRHRDLILYGIGLKISYCLTAFGHQLATGIPSMWIPWAWADLVFLALFIYAWRITGMTRVST
jgi:hypothetical protein